MSGKSGVFNAVQPPEEMFSLLYTIGYRLTGDHRLTSELIEVSINALNMQGQQGVVRLLSRSKNIGISPMLRTLCTTFINKTTAVRGRDRAAASLISFEFTRGRPQMQEALLYLPPMERLLVVLRDILDLNYAEIADLTGLEKTDVACLLSAGRWSLRELLAVSTASTNLSKRAMVAE